MPTDAQYTSPIFDRVIASPWTFLKVIYVILGSGIFLALVLMIVVEIKHQHPLYIAYGVALLLLLCVLLWAWKGLLFGQLSIL
jgi:hypothetical protein